MSIIKSKFLKDLEIDKILKKLSEKAKILEVKNRILNLNPEYNFLKIKDLLTQTDEALCLIKKFGDLPVENLENSDNLKFLLKRAKDNGRLSLREFLNISKVLKVIREIKSWSEVFKTDNLILNKIFLELVNNKYLENKINLIVISENEIADSASENLSFIRRKKREVSSNIKEQLEKIIRSSRNQKFLQDCVVTQRDGRFVVPVKFEFKNEISGLIHDFSSSGSTVFVEPDLIINLNNNLKSLNIEENKEIEKILSELSAEVGEFSEQILENYNKILDLDLIFAKAEFAISLKAVKLEINDSGKILLKKARHPLIPPEKAVPVDISLGENFDALVITGPNTGGKTVAVKIIGLFSVMIMYGLLIPAQEGSKLAVFEKILTDIGDEQSIEQSLSTFSGHISNIINIINEVNEKSLVILDELGAGTDPIEGAALAVSILEYLYKKGAKIAVTSHYAELKEYALVNKKIENASCEFDVNNLMPTYRLLVGVPGRSNAFAISERLGIKKEIIKRANEIISSEDRKLENSLIILEKNRKTLEEEKEKLDILNKNLIKEKIEIDKLKEEFLKEKEFYFKKIKIKTEKIIERTKRQAGLLLKELEEFKKENKIISGKKKINLELKLRNLDENLNLDNKEIIYNNNIKFKAGNNVIILSINKNAVVLEDENNNSDSILVQSGILKTRIKKNNLKLIKDKNINKKSGFINNNIKKAERKLVRELDLRGKTVIEADLDLSSFIDSAVILGINQLNIIHGKGTGVLRNFVHECLKNNPCVKNYRLGTFGEGESGVTIAELN